MFTYFTAAILVQLHQYSGSILASVNLHKTIRLISEVPEKVKC